MKKTVLFALIFTLLFSCMPITGFGAYEEPKIVFEDTFDESVLDVPDGWETDYNDDETYCYTQRNTAVAGKAVKMVTTNENKSTILTSKKIPVTPGQMYSAYADLFVVKGVMKVVLHFYDKNDNFLSSADAYSSVLNSWEQLSIAQYAPENAAYVYFKTVSAYLTLTEAYIDNARVYKGRYIDKKPQDIDPPRQADAVNAKIVEPNGDKLKYNSYNEQGDILPDFSSAGFYGGKYEIPDSSKLPVVAELKPSGKDDTKIIQNAIDEAYNNSPHNYMKVIKLKAGRYNINMKGIQMKSGVVLSGEGQGPDGTVLYATDPAQYAVIKIAGKPYKKSGDNAYITDDYVKAGSYEISIEPSKISEYKVGDLIVVHHPSEDPWSIAMGMKNIIYPHNGNDGSWNDGEIDMKTEKTIVKIEGNKITLDTPLFVPHIKKYAKSYIYKIDDSERLENIGVENLRVESYYNGDPRDEAHASVAVSVTNAKNCYIRDVSGKFLVNSVVSISDGAKWVSAVNCSMLEPVCTRDGGRAYSYALGEAQDILVTGSYSYNGRHEYTASNPGTGALVFVNNLSDHAYLPSEPHGLWTTGLLYDNLYCISNNANGYIMLGTNRGFGGTESATQGWPGATVVGWNCLSPGIVVQQPPINYQNFLVGEWGFYDDEYAKSRKDLFIQHTTEAFYVNQEGYEGESQLDNIIKTNDKTSFIGNGYIESENAPVEPRSIYRAQLAEKITGNFKNVKPVAPIITSPRGEEEDTLKTNDVVFKGIFQKGAEKVTLYIDNEPYEAELDNKECMFTLNVTLANGTHKVHATQTVNGVESTKCADRFIIVNKPSKHKDYLSSNYEESKINPLINDTRIPFDEYQKEAIKNVPENPITVEINNEKLVTDVAPVEINGRVLVPMRAIFEYYKADINWNESTATATATRNGRTVSVTENSTVAKVDGQDYILDVPATIINGRFVVPVRFISESFGSDVGWIDAKKIVTIKHSIRNDIRNEIKIVKLVQSADDGAGAVIENAVDGDTNTGWATDKDDPRGAFGIFEFDDVKNVKDIYISFKHSDIRTYNFDIYASTDGENYTEVFKGRDSTMGVLGWQNFQINTSAKFIKIVGHGHKEGTWNNYLEILFTENK